LETRLGSAYAQAEREHPIVALMLLVHIDSDADLG
jgi:hypothetical protein